MSAPQPSKRNNRKTFARIFSCASCAAAISLAGLGACTTQQAGGIASAAATPLSDLNLVNAPIPDTLKTAQSAPYAQPATLSCQALTADIGALDEVLGADLDTPSSDTNPGLVERAGNLVAQQATQKLRATTENLIPFRAWIRKLSGAERYSKQVAAAIAAGTIRRAFLKGLAVSQSCVAS